MNERERNFQQSSESEKGDIRYTSPSEIDPEVEKPQHKLELRLDGEVIGGAEIDYYSKPLPFYQLTDLWVEHEYAGRGNASRIMDQVENFLKERRKPGVLVEAILDDSAQGMYERRGWMPVPDGLGRHVYNWPDGVSLDVLKGYEERQTPIDEREGYTPGY
jgi:GNAT superfamily N-acetyltransferase